MSLKNGESWSIRVGDGPEIPVDPDVLNESVSPGGLNRVAAWKQLERIARLRLKTQGEKSASAAEFSAQLKQLDKEEERVLQRLDAANSQPSMFDDPGEDVDE
jgi:hypothetical protein